MASMNRPKAIDLFCGAGGMSLGFEQAGFDVVLAVDFDPYHVATHERNFPYGESWGRSVAELQGAEIRQKFGEIDVLFGGPPCQGFSHMGLRRSDDPRNSLISEFVRVVCEVRPKAVVMENVLGLGTRATKPVLDFVVSMLQSNEYEIASPIRSLNAIEYGVPQARERLFLMAIRRDCIKTPLRYPDPLVERVTVWEALADLPELNPELPGSDETLPYAQAPTSRYAAILRGQERDTHDFGRKRKWNSSLSSGCTQVKHSPQVIALYAATPPGQMVPGHKLPRLAKNGYAPTLRAGSTSDHGSHTAPRPVHPVSPRCITVREAARLHGFPDWFEFYPSKWHAYRQIGNAVCPPVAHAIGLQVAWALGIEPQQQGSPINLSSSFKLEKRTKNHGRLKDVDEFPKVLEWLLSRYRGQGITHIDIRDIENAIQKTNAQLPRISAANFFRSVGKSRNLKKILSPFHDQQLTIKTLPQGEAQIVPLGTPGAIDDRDQLAIQSAELMAAIPLDHLPSVSVEDLQIWSHLQSAEWSNVRLRRDLFGDLTEPILFDAVVNQIVKSGVVIATSGAALPRRSWISSLMKQNKAELALVVAQLTQEHSLVVALEDQEGVAIEKAREIFVKRQICVRELVAF